MQVLYAKLRLEEMIRHASHSGRDGRRRPEATLEEGFKISKQLYSQYPSSSPISNALNRGRCLNQRPEVSSWAWVGEPSIGCLSLRIVARERRESALW